MDKSSELVDSSLLAKIDGLFACGAGDYVDLPQLVVVGHQSSGKSSVLVGLTSLPFPRDSGLCTRFATQIIFRRSAATGISASIVPSKESSSDQQEAARAWGKKELGHLDENSFASIMAEVTEVMKVGRTVSDDGPGLIHRPAFSRDVLVLEISGPSQEHFSVIDVPGTFKRTTEGVTTKDDIALVDEMVNSYMANPRSVMLTVVPCNADIATQEVVQIAEDLDPNGDRTLGILTKPDLVDKGAEQSVIDLVQGKRHRLKLGWHLLRNPGQAELLEGSKARHEIEEVFFSTVQPWKALDKDRVGIKSLKQRLQETLTAHIRREFPKVRLEIAQKSRTATERLKQLGPRRQTQFELTQYLVDIAHHFQETSAAAARADYRSTSFFNNKTARLATTSVNRGLEFSRNMAEHGHYFSFRSSNEPSGDIVELDLSLLSVIDDAGLPTRHLPGHPDIADLLAEDASVSHPLCENNILSWLKAVYNGSRGFELGTFASSLLTSMMQEQAQKWQKLAMGYISDLVSLVHSFIVELLHHIVRDQRVRDSLMAVLVDQLREKYQSALNQTDFLLNVELGGTPATYNHYFNDILDKCRQERLQSELAQRAFSDCKHGHVIRMQDIVHNHPLSNDDHIIREIHDILQAYYKLARKRFVDNVRMQAADHFLITGPDTPLTLFSPMFVAGLTATELENIAGEEASTKWRRIKLEEEVRLLEEGLKILR